MVESELTAYFDIDSTLIFDLTSEEARSVLPTSQDHIFLGEGIFRRPFRVNWKMVDKIYFHKAAGHKVIVWSKSGREYARLVVGALMLQQHVDSCESKPFVYYDDKHASEFMGDPSYV